ncbi:MAG: 7-carboxy-7-deazaguanine synthase [Saprospiraceae bacterium]|jgi:7-carboxy-7-deazaguanine synthase
MYKVKEIYYTLQGEGFHTGRPAVFCRFSGCNLWSGREEDRHKAICKFCDTDFWGIDGENGGKYTAIQLAQKVKSLWPENGQGTPYVVCTGGEPLLQLDEKMIEAFHQEGLEIAVETNGTIKAPKGLDWICMSPKAGAEIILTKGDELKLVFPQTGAEPEKYEDLDFDQFFLQPMDSPEAKLNTKLTLAYCLANPKWSLSLQTHKILDIP